MCDGWCSLILEVCLKRWVIPQFYILCRLHIIVPIYKDCGLSLFCMQPVAIDNWLMGLCLCRDNLHVLDRIGNINRVSEL